MFGRMVIASTAFLVISFATAFGAGPFDGNWQGTSTVPGDSYGCHDQNVTMTVANGAVTGLLMRERSSNQLPITGTVAADGAFNGEIVGQTGTMALRGKFAANSFDGGFKFRNCQYRVTLQKAS